MREEESVTEQQGHQCSGLSMAVPRDTEDTGLPSGKEQKASRVLGTLQAPGEHGA